MGYNVIIVTSSYGADYIKQIGGQYYIIAIIKAAGAYGLEIRRELLSETELMQLPKLARQIIKYDLHCFYSVPCHLFIEDGTLNPNLGHYLHEAQQLNAKLIKFSLGYFNENSQLGPLKALLEENHDLQLVVENDQSECGTIAPFEDFFTQIAEHAIPIKMTFDTGNWLCLNIDPIEAAQRLSQYVAYIHVKAAKLIAPGKIDALAPTVNDSWMYLINHYLPKSAFRGIEFAITGDDLESVSKKYINLLSH